MQNEKKVIITPFLGVDLNPEHYSDVLAQHHDRLGWVEVHPEDYFGGGKNVAMLEEIRLSYPVSLHSTGLSLGSDQAINKHYLEQLKELIYRFQPFLVSAHAAWNAIDNEYLCDQLPLPYTQEVLKRISQKIDQTQKYLGRQILIENPSTYITYAINEMTEPAFLNLLISKTGCGLLLDLNNVFIQSENHQFDPYAYLDELDLKSIQEIHIAGHKRHSFDDGYLLLNSHDQPVAPEVWTLYQYIINKIGPCYTLIEWDLDLPQFKDLLKEVWKAEKYLAEALKRAA